MGTAVADPLAFHQYWALRAVESCGAAGGADQVPLGVVRRLWEFSARTPPRNVRGEVAGRILTGIDER
ncbi:hypothetical protein [Streptomyces achromogenes]|uniref:hypothetical protein n=1 Tax=Streptomyces achromogenes TaxID=67255 RepID=UPI0036B589D7